MVVVMIVVVMVVMVVMVPISVARMRASARVRAVPGPLDDDGRACWGGNRMGRGRVPASAVHAASCPEVARAGAGVGDGHGPGGRRAVGGHDGAGREHGRTSAKHGYKLESRTCSERLKQVE